MGDNQTPPERLLQEILDLARDMQRLARAGEWDKVRPLEEHRRSLLEQSLTPSISFADKDQAEKLIREIVALDKELMELATQARDEVGDALSKIKQGRGAVRAYQEVDTRSRP